MAEAKHTQSWAELAIDLYDKLTGRNAEITYEFENMEVWAPSGVGQDAEHGHWKINGILKMFVHLMLMLQKIFK